MPVEPEWDAEVREPIVDFDPQMPEQAPAPPPVQPETTSEEFPLRHREPFDGLLWLGYLTRTFQWMGHSFTIKTLTTEESLAVGQFCRKWGDTMAAGKGYQVSTCAMALVEVDGKPMAQSLGMDETLLAQLSVRYNQVKHWFGLTFDRIYEEYLDLEARQSEIVAAMGKVLDQEPTPIPG